MSTEAAVIGRDISVQRGGHRVLRAVSFELPRGGVTGLLGPSGCGKSTLMRAIVGVQRRMTGELRVLGLPAGSAPLRSRIGYQTQAPAVYQDLTVAENLAYFAALLPSPAGQREQVIASVGLEPLAGRLVRTLSGGQLSRVSLAIALLGRPELLVLDEPTVGLDPILRESLWKIFRALAAEGVTLLVSSHVMDEAARCDRALLLREGALLAHLSASELSERTGTQDLDEAFLRLIESAP